MSVRAFGSRLVSESCPVREKTCPTFVSTVRRHVVYLKTTKYKGNRIHTCHIISHSFSIPSSVLIWKTWPPPNLITDYINLNRISHFGLKSTHTTKSYWEFRLLSWKIFQTHRSVCPYSFLRASVEEETPWKWLTIVSSPSLESSFQSPLTFLEQSKKKNQMTWENKKT